MQDLRYLNVSDLERLLDNLATEAETLKNSRNTGTSLHEQHVKANADLYNAVEAEILERTLLGAKTDDGVSN